MYGWVDQTGSRNCIFEINLNMDGKLQHFKFIDIISRIFSRILAAFRALLPPMSMKYEQTVIVFLLLFCYSSCYCYSSNFYSTDCYSSARRQQKGADSFQAWQQPLLTIVRLSSDERKSNYSQLKCRTDFPTQILPIWNWKPKTNVHKTIAKQKFTSVVSKRWC